MDGMKIGWPREGQDINCTIRATHSYKAWVKICKGEGGRVCCGSMVDALKTRHFKPVES